MKSSEKGVLKKSDLYFCTPSATAKRLYFYPVSAGHYYCKKGYHLVRNSFDSLLITHIIDGAFTFVINGESITAHKGDTVLLNCFEPHEYYTDSSFEGIWVHFGGANCMEMYDELTRIEGNLIRCSDPEHVKKLLFRLLDCVSGDKSLTEISISLDIYKLLCELAAPLHINSKSNTSYSETVQDAKKYISDHLGEDITVKDIAASIHMSASHFSKIFKQLTGFSPYDYVLISRLNRAKEYLQKTNLTVAEIAYEVGFNSESNFIYCFTSAAGLSPNKFRKLKF